jgi:hypothetical protein
MPGLVVHLVFSKRRIVMRWKIAFVMAASVVALGARITSARVDLPSGERQLGQAILEPAYDDRNGSIIYLSTPIGAPFPSKSNPKASSPLYLVEYPNSARAFAGTMNCAHQPQDNCPDHGPGIAQFAASSYPDVYGDPDGSDVWGHDHLVDGPGGKDFNVSWTVHLIFFTRKAAANTHVTTDAQVEALVAAGDAVDIPDVTFQCAVVNAAAYRRATPLPPALPIPVPPSHLR